MENTKKITVVDVASEVDSGATFYIEDNGVFRRTKTEKVKDVLGVTSLEKNVNTIQDRYINKNVLYDVLHNTPHAKTCGDFFDLKRTGKIYRTRIPLFSTNPTTTCEKLLDNKDLVFEPSTDTVEGRDDYLNGENPLFEWWDCNYKRNDDGSPYPTAIKGEEGFSYTGNVDVGTIQMSFYYEFKQHPDEGYVDLTISDTPQLLRADMVLTPWSECVKPDGTVLPYCIGSKYISSIGDDNLLRSVKDSKPENFQSYSNMIVNYQKKGKGYYGAGAERNTFQTVFILIKCATKSSQAVFTGCTNYNLQYTASIERSTNDTYFPVTNSQADNLIVGSNVCIGYAGIKSGTTNTADLDRGQGNMRKYAKMAKIIKIESIDDNNKAVYLDVDAGFPTTKVTVTDGLVSPVYLSTMSWNSGTTDNVIGKHDGSMVSNANSKYPYRIQGREYAIGAYIIPSDTVLFFQNDYSKDVYVAPKGVIHTTNETTIKNTYKLIGNILANTNGGDYWIGDIAIDAETGGWFPSSKGSGSSQGFGDMLYAGGATTSGTREYLQGGGLWSGSHAGFAFLLCGAGLDGANWYCCAAD